MTGRNLPPGANVGDTSISGTDEDMWWEEFISAVEEAPLPRWMMAMSPDKAAGLMVGVMEAFLPAAQASYAAGNNEGKLEVMLEDARREEVEMMRQAGETDPEQEAEDRHFASADPEVRFGNEALAQEDWDPDEMA